MVDQIQGTSYPEVHTINCVKMQVNYSEVKGMVQYRLNDTVDTVINFNQLLEKEITLSFSGVIHCLGCNGKINKTFNGGYCYRCFRGLARCDMCIMKPNLCHYAAGTCREPSWGLENCFKPHILYLAQTDKIKVGITRETNLPMRWIDQGAVQGLAIARTSSRRAVGILEQVLMDKLADKTNWRKMLTAISDPLEDLHSIRDDLFANELADAQQYLTDPLDTVDILLDANILNITYPLAQAPRELKTLDLHKQPLYTGKLVGIKGQYLVFTDKVLNMRKYGGYQIGLAVS